MAITNDHKLIRVYRYQVFCEERDGLVDTKFRVWASLEKISSIGGQPIMDKSIEVEEPEINERGFYHG